MVISRYEYIYIRSLLIRTVRNRDLLNLENLNVWKRKNFLIENSLNLFGI